MFAGAGSPALPIWHSPLPLHGLPVVLLGRHRQQLVPVPIPRQSASLDSLHVTPSRGCLPAALLLQRGSEGSAQGPAVSA